MESPVTTLIELPARPVDARNQPFEGNHAGAAEPQSMNLRFTMRSRKEAWMVEALAAGSEGRRTRVNIVFLRTKVRREALTCQESNHPQYHPKALASTGKSLIFYGERGRNRTYNLVIKSHLLCQLSYAPAFEGWLESGAPSPVRHYQLYHPGRIVTSLSAFRRGWPRRDLRDVQQLRRRIA